MSAWRSLTRGTSLRARLAALFAIGTAALLFASAAFLYLSLAHELDAAIDDGLRARADDVVADLRGGQRAVRRDEAFAEVLDANGRVVAASATIGRPRQPVVAMETVRQAELDGRDRFVDRDVEELRGHARLLVRPVMARGRRLVVVVGASREAVDRSRRRLALVLTIASPVLIGTLAAGGWLVAGAALRPVERMTRRAGAIADVPRGERLPQPPGDDEIARLGATLNAMLDRIDGAVEREQAFLDDASHELRTPVSILRAELELALLDAADGRDVAPSLRSALEEAERLHRLAEDLLVLARGAGRRLPLRPEPVDLAPAVADAIDRTGGAGGGEEDVVVVVRGDGVVVDADRARLEQLLVNLLGNARRFATSRVVVEVAAGSVRVADDGPGFAPDVLAVAFDRFTRGTPSRSRDGGGSGLGLAIAAALARAHGWSISAANGPPVGGAVVTVTFDGSAGAEVS